MFENQKNRCKCFRLIAEVILAVEETNRTQEVRRNKKKKVE